MKEWGEQRAEGATVADVGAAPIALGKSNLSDATADDGGSSSASGSARPGSLFGTAPPWSAGGGARGEGSSADSWQPAPRLIAMDAPAERETDITTTTVAAPEGGTRRRTVGIGEAVTMRSPTATKWEAAGYGPGSGPTNGSVFKWVAPEQPGNVTVTAGSKKGAPQTITMSVVAPQDIEFQYLRDASPGEMRNQRVGAGMMTKVNLLPRTVSFDHLMWKEEPNQASNPTGFFSANAPPAHEPVEEPLQVKGLRDLAVYFNRVIPREGSFDWLIKNTIQVNGGAETTTLDTVQHVKTEASPREGFATVTKRGTATPAASSKMRGPNGQLMPAPKVDAPGAGGGALGCGNGQKAVMGDAIEKIPVAHGNKEPEEKDDPNKVPKEFAKLPKELIAVLFASRTHLKALRDPAGVKFWDAMQAMSVADLHTLVQVHKGTMAAGLWPLIKVIDVIYTYSTSWGVHFLGSPSALVKNGQWGRDNPQWLVASQHPDGEKFEWYRQNTGAGNPGLHMGLDKGAGHHDVHWDPTNPMERVGTGEIEFKYNPIGLPLPVRHAKGDAVYDTAEGLKHMAEVGGITGESKNADATKDFLGGYFLDETRKHARNYVGFESDPATQAHTTNTARSMACVANVNSQIAVAEGITTQMRQLAMTDDKEAAPLREALKLRIQQTRNRLIDRMVELFQHMKGETPNVDAKGYDTHAGWKTDTFSAYDTCKALAEARQKKF